MKDFRRLKVWDKAHSLALAVYKASTGFPRSESVGLTAQIRRASASIPANLAEGCGRQTDRGLCRYVAIASGSAGELEYHLLLARDLGYLDRGTYEKLHRRVVEVKRMLAGLAGRVRMSSKLKACIGRKPSPAAGRELTADR